VFPALPSFFAETKRNDDTLPPPDAALPPLPPSAADYLLFPVRSTVFFFLPLSDYPLLTSPPLVGGAVLFFITSFFRMVQACSPRAGASPFYCALISPYLIYRSRDDIALSP